MNKKYLFFLLSICILFGLIFFISAVSFEQLEWKNFCSIFIFGATLGGLFILEFESKVIKKTVLFQTLVGTIGGAVFAICQDFNLQTILASLVIGATMGLFAQFWIKYLPAP